MTIQSNELCASRPSIYSLLLLAFLSKVPVGSATPSEPQLPKGQMPNSRTAQRTRMIRCRHSISSDTSRAPWEFEWDVPDSPRAGRSTDRKKGMTSQGIDGRYYESRIEAERPEWLYTVHSKIVYHPDNKVVARHDSDSRGFSMLAAGSIGGDLGGYYTI